jgi:hypothetical protein
MLHKQCAHVWYIYNQVSSSITQSTWPSQIVCQKRANFNPCELLFRSDTISFILVHSTKMQFATCETSRILKSRRKLLSQRHHLRRRRRRRRRKKCFLEFMDTRNIRDEQSVFNSRSYMVLNKELMKDTPRLLIWNEARGCS